MGIERAVESIRERWKLRQDSLDDGGWKTIKGTHVLIDENGEMSGGPQKLKDWHSGKKGYGKAGGSKPKGPKASDCKNGKELREHLKNQHGIEMTNPCASWMSKEENFPMMRDVFTAYEKFLEKVPELEGYPKLIRLGSKGVLATDGTELLINRNHFQSMEAVEKMCKKNSDSHHWHPNSSIGSLLAHELGHIVEHQIIKKEMAGESQYSKTIVWNEHHKAYSVVKEALEHFKKQGHDLKGMWQMQKSISKYAMASPAETLAESFADVFANGKNANEYSRKIVNIALRRLRK